MKRKVKFAALILSVAVLASCGMGNGGKGDNDNNKSDISSENAVNTEGTANASEADKAEFVPDVVGMTFDEGLQQKLMNEGFLLSVEYEYSDNASADKIISQSPEAGTVCGTGGVYLDLIVSAGPDNTQQDADSAENADKTEGTDISDDPTKDNGDKSSLNSDIKWIISPTVVYDDVYTFGKTGYSICHIYETYGVIDMNGVGKGTGDYSKLFYCPEHGLSSPDVTEAVSFAEDLVLSPDCGYENQDRSENIYVYDNIRSRVYLTGMSDGVFRIVDITDTEFFKSNERYIAVLYNCDADLMMYDGAGMENLEDIFKAENRKMKYGVVNNNFEHIIAFVYDSITDGNDCYIVEEKGKFGYRGTSGQYYYSCVFQKANTAYKGAAWVKYNGKWGTVAF